MAQVRTSLGVLEGRERSGLALFRGVPFAQPPVGERRFHPPAPPGPWDGVRPALESRAAPPQIIEGMTRELGLFGDQPLDEDCLYLNTWAPLSDGPPRPVMVWIPGGAFMNGSGSAPAYDGARLASRGDVVVVTVTYRVGVLGFLELGDLPLGSPGARANLGLLDQLEALRWVQREIAAFGGDPGNVTVFGESAGAGSIAALLAMPASRGLFRRAIVQSGAIDGVIPAADALLRTEKILDKLGLDRGSAADLQHTPPDAILEAQRAALAEGPYTAGMYFLPVIGGPELPRTPIEAVAAGAAAGVELLIGSTRDEMQLYALALGTGEMPQDRLERIANRRAPGKDADGEPLGALLLETYRAAREARGEPVAPPDLYHALESDFRLRVPAIRLAEAQARHQPRTFMYLFTWTSPRYDGALGSCHALDIPFTFGTIDVPPLDELTGNGPEARALSDHMIDAWTGFARRGTPGHPGIGAWPSFDAARRATMILGPKCGLEHAPREPERAIWERVGAAAAG